jgi:mannose-6-phosphate isomerase-like protein (cupin superfamily)
MEAMRLQAEPSYLAPDGSEIRELLHLENSHGNMAHCVLRSGSVSVAQRHKTVGEIWYCVQGLGQVWRKRSSGQPPETIIDIWPGMCLTIEVGTHFQFRNTGAEPLTFIIATIPSWPRPEAEEVQGRWGDSGELKSTSAGVRVPLGAGEVLWQDDVSYARFEGCARWGAVPGRAHRGSPHPLPHGAGQQL